MSQLNFYVIPFLAYVLVANPATYKAVRGVLGSWVASAEGLATFPGLLLHAAVFVALVSFLMRVVPAISNFELNTANLDGDFMSPRDRRRERRDLQRLEHMNRRLTRGSEDRRLRPLRPYERNVM